MFFKFYSPGSASPSSLAARFTPSPKISSSWIMTSPKFIPILRTSLWLESTSTSLCLTVFWIATAHSTASTTLANYANTPSPKNFTTRPACWAIFESIDAVRSVFHRLRVENFSRDMSREKSTTSSARNAASRHCERLVIGKFFGHA